MSDKKPEKGTDKKDRTMIPTIIAAAAIIMGALAIVALYRFTNLFDGKPTEKRIAQNLDLSDSQWADTLMEISIPSYKKDFSIYSAFSDMNGRNILTQVYATRADLNDVRIHYSDLLQNTSLSSNNSAGVLELSGEFKGRKVTVINYFSEVSNLIQVEMEMSGEYTDLIWNKISASFPLQALEAVPEIAQFARGESTEAFVMYNYDTFAADVYANVPVFSRAYRFNGTLEELKKKIDALGETFTGSAVISGGIAEIKYNAWLYQVKAMESFSGVKVALIIQAVPNS